jgi:hypothetical protein
MTGAGIATVHNVALPQKGSLVSMTAVIQERSMVRRHRGTSGLCGGSGTLSRLSHDFSAVMGEWHGAAVARAALVRPMPGRDRGQFRTGSMIAAGNWRYAPPSGHDHGGGHVLAMIMDSHPGLPGGEVGTGHATASIVALLFHLARMFHDNRAGARNGVPDMGGRMPEREPKSLPPGATGQPNGRWCLFPATKGSAREWMAREGCVSSGATGRASPHEGQGMSCSTVAPMASYVAVARWSRLSSVA